MNWRLQDEEMRLREVAEAEKQQMMKARQQKLLEGQQVIWMLTVATTTNRSAVLWLQAAAAQHAWRTSVA